jgi:hypothetical protein
VNSEIRKEILLWIEHVLRMPDQRIVKKVFAEYPRSKKGFSQYISSNMKSSKGSADKNNRPNI